MVMRGTPVENLQDDVGENSSSSDASRICGQIPAVNFGGILQNSQQSGLFKTPLKPEVLGHSSQITNQLGKLVGPAG